MSKTLAAAAFAVTALMAVQPATAAVVITSSVNDILPASSVLLDFTPYYAGTNPGYQSHADITIGGTTISGGYLAEGTNSSVAAAPYIGTIGVDENAYLAAESNSPVVLTFSKQQNNFGLLWGSVDSYNTLTFYNGDTVVETLTGLDVDSTANGYQGAGGSVFVSAQFTDGLTFDKVVATSGSPAFEFDYVSSVAAVPEPSMWFLMLSGFGAVGFAMRSRKSAVAAA